MLALGLDIGTRSVKALLLDADGTIRGSALVDYL